MIWELSGGPKESLLQDLRRKGLSTMAAAEGTDLPRGGAALRAEPRPVLPELLSGFTATETTTKTARTHVPTSDPNKARWVTNLGFGAICTWVCDWSGLQ